MSCMSLCVYLKTNMRNDQNILVRNNIALVLDVWGGKKLLSCKTNTFWQNDCCQLLGWVWTRIKMNQAETWLNLPWNRVHVPNWNFARRTRSFLIRTIITLEQVPWGEFHAGQERAAITFPWNEPHGVSKISNTYERFSMIVRNKKQTTST